MRAPIYKCTASLRFELPEKNEETDEKSDIQFIVVQRQDLKSNPILTKTLYRLLEEKGSLIINTSFNSVSNLKNILKVIPTDDMKVVKLSANGQNRELLPLLLNSWIDVCLESAADLDRPSFTSTNRELNQQVSELKHKVIEKRLELEEYRGKHDIVSVERTENRTPAGYKGLVGALKKAEKEQAVAESQFKAKKDMIEQGKIVIRGQDQRILSILEKKVVGVQEQLNEMRRRYTPEFLRIDNHARSLVRKLELLEKEIGSKRQEIQHLALLEVKQNKIAAQQIVIDLRQQLETHKKTTTATFTNSLEGSNALEKELSQLEALYSKASEQFAEADATNRQPTSAIIVLERAFLPEFRKGPQYFLDAGICVAGSFILGIVSVLFNTFIIRPPNHEQVESVQNKSIISNISDPEKNQIPVIQEVKPGIKPEQNLPHEFKKPEVKDLADTADNSNLSNLHMKQSSNIIPGMIPGYVPLLFLIFIIYGSLLPFEQRDVSFEKAISMFSRIHYLNLGVASRADWIANILIYIPLSFFSLAWLDRRFNSASTKIILRFVTLFLFALIAITIEFFQIFIAPRTVSLNDLIAEFTGIILGMILWFTIGKKLIGVWHEIKKGGDNALTSALALYSLLYLALSLFPYDFLVSLSEISLKFSSNSIALFILSSAFDRPLYFLMTLCMEIVLTIPLGFLISVRLTTNSKMYFRLFLLGILLGTFIEGIQLFIASGLSQGVSVFTRGFGFVLGLWFFNILPARIGTRPNSIAGLASGQNKPILLFRPYITYIPILAILPYILLLLSVNGYFNHNLISLEDAISKLDKRMFLPFYYQYFTTETRAVTSLLYNLTMYAPIGAGCWVFSYSRSAERSVFNGVTVGCLGGIVAFVVESGKLILAVKHPDFTNVVIAAVSAGLSFGAIDWVLRIIAEYTHVHNLVKPEPKKRH
ncbi:MAG: hypothetical protein GY931_04675 [Maribacter sp.]|nr:hypothetical protein [Maribacter sp.]